MSLRKLGGSREVRGSPTRVPREMQIFLFFFLLRRSQLKMLKTRRFKVHASSLRCFHTQPTFVGSHRKGMYREKAWQITTPWCLKKDR